MPKFEIDPLSAILADRQFAIIFHHVQDTLGCPPPTHRPPLMHKECWAKNECLLCWRGYTRTRALVELGLVEKRDDNDVTSER